MLSFFLQANLNNSSWIAPVKHVWKNSFDIGFISSNTYVISARWRVCVCQCVFAGVIHTYIAIYHSTRSHSVFWADWGSWSWSGLCFKCFCSHAHYLIWDGIPFTKTSTVAHQVLLYVMRFKNKICAPKHKSVSGESAREYPKHVECGLIWEHYLVLPQNRKIHQFFRNSIICRNV